MFDTSGLRARAVDPGHTLAPRSWPPARPVWVRLDRLFAHDPPRDQAVAQGLELTGRARGVLLGWKRGSTGDWLAVVNYQIWTGRNAVHGLRLLEPVLTRHTARKAAALALGLPPEDRLEALVPLLRHLPAHEVEAALTAGFAGVGQGDRNFWLQWRVLERTIGRLPAQLATTVVEHTTEISDEGQRALVLAHMVRHLTGPAALRAWQAAFELSSRCKYPGMRAEALGLLAAAVPGDDNDLLAALLAAAMEVARRHRADSARFFRGRFRLSHGWGDHFGFRSEYLIEDVLNKLPAPEDAVRLLMAVHDRAAPDRRAHLATMAWRFSEQIPQPTDRFRLQVELALLPGAGLDGDRERSCWCRPGTWPIRSSGSIP